MLVITRIATHRKDGSKVGQRERRAVLNLVRDTFGGYTLEGPFQGAWVADDGRAYEETSYYAGKQEAHTSLKRQRRSAPEHLRWRFRLVCGSSLPG